MSAAFATGVNRCGRRPRSRHAKAWTPAAFGSRFLRRPEI